MPRHIFLYGPPGSGKSTLGRALAETLALPFTDLDAEVERRAGMPVPQIFAARGERAFRRMEREALQAVCQSPEARLVALGGGALLDERSRALAERCGTVLLLHAPPETLAARLQADATARPLAAAGRLPRLLAARRAHYASFPRQLASTAPLPDLVWQAQVALGAFRVEGMGPGYDVRVQPGGLEALGAHLRSRGLHGPVALVTDENVAAHHAPRALAALRQAGYAAESIVLPAGEAHKTLETVSRLWEAFLGLGLERGSTVAALGGGVVSDLAGFAAAAYLRGIPWVAVPTSLLGMVDASLGGKTGADLPQGKNLIGAFHAPRLVLADPQTLATLPEDEFRNGMAEVIKHGVIGDPGLFAAARRGEKPDTARAMAVKIRIIRQDPYEGGQRATLNFGHTIGHALEQASGYRLRHGEAVAIGMVAEARLAERLELAEKGLAEEIAAALSVWGLPTEIPPEIPAERWQAVMQFDKKKRRGVVHFALPVRLGEVRAGIRIDEHQIANLPGTRT